MKSLVNYAAGKSIVVNKGFGWEKKAKLVLISGLIFNLSMLAFFKYFDFVIINFSLLTGSDLKPFGIPLPLGISFFTFTQIAYLVDCYAGKVREYKASNYGLFVTYFPHLIAGPILHHKEMMPQFETVTSHTASRGRITVGLLFLR